MDVKRTLLLLLFFCLGSSAFAQNSWGLKNGTRIEGTILRFSPNGEVVMKTATGISNIPLANFDKASIENLENQFAAVNVKKLAGASKPNKQQRAQKKIQGWHQMNQEQKTALYVMGAGVIVMFFSWILLLVAAFKENPMWGIAILLFSIAGLIFYILHFGKAKLSFLLQLVAFAAIGGGYWMLISSGP